MDKETIYKVSLNYDTWNPEFDIMAVNYIFDWCVKNLNKIDYEEECPTVCVMYVYKKDINKAKEEIINECLNKLNQEVKQLNGTINKLKNIFKTD